MPDLATIRDCEERLVNVWPALQTLMLGDWVLRFANGYTGRANSASAIRAGADLSGDDLAHIAWLYREAGLPPAIRVTPLAVPELAERLSKAGWRAIVTSIGMVAPAREWRSHAGVTLAPRASAAWIAGVSFWQEERKRNGGHLKAILDQIRLHRAFATVSADGAPAGYGLSVMDRGMAEIGSILIGPEARGRGHGRALVETLLAWARDAGAMRAFLQVEENNAAAIALYRDLGFAEVYRYTEYRLVI